MWQCIPNPDHPVFCVALYLCVLYPFDQPGSFRKSAILLDNCLRIWKIWEKHGEMTFICTKCGLVYCLETLHICRRKGFKHYDDMGNYCVGDCDDLFLKLNIQDLIIPTGNQAMAHKKIMASALRSQTGGNCGIVSDCPRCLKRLFWRHNLSPSEKPTDKGKKCPCPMDVLHYGCCFVFRINDHRSFLWIGSLSISKNS